MNCFTRFVVPACAAMLLLLSSSSDATASPLPGSGTLARMVQPGTPNALLAPPASKELVCNDGTDNDGDLVFDCGDADCKKDPACQSDGQPENSDARCSDWVDNDSDGYVDCEDIDCNGMDTCKGSWDIKAAPAGGGGTSTVAGGNGKSSADVRELAPGQTEADLIGQGNDADGERNNVFCSDGIDNDNDGQIDCADLGCRLDTQVTVCQGSGDFRFSAVARIAQTFVINEDSQLAVDDMGNVLPGEELERFDTQFDTLQLRVLGQLPYIQNSFFLMSMRVERSPRLTFALFQVPVGKKGHYLNVNSGGGGLSLELIRSVHKRLMTDPAFYVYNAFEQGNGAAIEAGGPIDKRGRFLFRTFLAGGSGRFNGNIGGRFFPDNEDRYTYSAGGQVWVNAVGYYTRWDSPFLYTAVPLTFATGFGVKYDQRVQERYPAANLQFVFRYKIMILLAEAYAKRELEFENWQVAYNAQLGVLVWPKRVMLAADFGQYLATDFENPPEVELTDLRRQLRELQYRFAAHVYLWRDVFYGTLIFRDRRVEPVAPRVGIQVARDVRFLLTYRF